MSAQNGGGFAFPRPGFPAIHSGAAPGMSLRDWFAGQALSGLLACQSTSGDSTSFAVSAYAYADAMLAERVPKTEENAA